MLDDSSWNTSTLEWDWFITVSARKRNEEQAAQQLLKRLRDGGFLIKPAPSSEDSTSQEVIKQNRTFLVGVSHEKLSQLAREQGVANSTGRQRKQLRRVESSNMGKPFDPAAVTSGARLKLVQSSLLELISCGEVRVKLVPLHNKRERERLANRWVWGMPLSSAPVHQIRDYFGDEVGYYASFLDVLTKALVPLAILGVSVELAQLYKPNAYGPTTTVLFALVLTIWATCVTELLKRKQARLDFSWNSTSTGFPREVEPPQASFLLRANAVSDPSTGLVEYQYPQWKRYVAIVFSTVVCLAMCVISIGALLLFLDLDQYASKHWRGAEWKEGVWRFAPYGPQIGYTLLVVGSTAMSKNLVSWLNYLECHRTRSDDQNSAIFKLVWVQFVNNFASLFYAAFVLRDLNALEVQLQALMCTYAATSQALELGIPYVSNWIRLRGIFAKLKGTKVPEKELSSKVELAMQQATREDMALEPFEMFADYLELWIQFGNIILFGVVMPWAAGFALLNNLVEMRTDAHRLLFMTARPVPLPQPGYGSWLLVFEACSTIAVITNIALIAIILNSQVCVGVEQQQHSDQSVNHTTTTSSWMAGLNTDIFEAANFVTDLTEGILASFISLIAIWLDTDWVTQFCNMSDSYKVASLVILEHLFLALKWGIAQAIPDKPAHIRRAIERDQLRLVQRVKRDAKVREELTSILNGVKVPDTNGMSPISRTSTPVSRSLSQPSPVTIKASPSNGYALQGSPRSKVETTYSPRMTPLKLPSRILLGDLDIRASDSDAIDCCDDSEVEASRRIVSHGDSAVLEAWVIQQIAAKNMAESKYREAMKRLADSDRRKQGFAIEDMGGLVMLVNVCIGVISVVAILTSQ